MTSKEWLQFLYPYFFDNEDERYVETADIDVALTMGLAKAPSCELVPTGSDQQLEAVAHYAAYVLDTRHSRKKNGGNSAGMVLRREKEGDVEKEYTEQLNAEKANILEGRETPFERYKEIFDKCPQTGTFMLRTKRI